jgi:acetyl-CoA synthetase
MNVGGNRIGTEEIENTLLMDRRRQGSPVLNCAVVGMPHKVLGTVPCAFIVVQPGRKLSPVDEGSMRSLVQNHLSPAAVPGLLIAVHSLPETYSGKFMRRLLQCMVSEVQLGDLGALRNPECIEHIQEAVRAALKPPSAKRAQRVDKRWRPPKLLKVTLSLAGPCFTLANAGCGQAVFRL